MLFYGNPAPDAELVVMYGNCQIPFLASLLAAAHGDKGFLCVLNHAPPGEEPDRPTPEQMQRCCLYLEQYDSQFDLAAWGVPPEVGATACPCAATCASIVRPRAPRSPTPAL